MFHYILIITLLTFQVVFTITKPYVCIDTEDFWILIKKDQEILKYIKRYYTNNPEFMLEAIRINYKAGKFIGDNLKSDESFILKVRELYPDASILKYVNDSLKDNKELIIKAMNCSPRILTWYLSKKLLNDKDIMLKAVVHAQYSMNHVGDKLLNDKEFILDIIKERKGRFWFYERVGKEILDDRDFVLKAVSLGSFYVLKYTNYIIRNDKEIMLESFKHSLSSLEYMGKKLRDLSFKVELIQFIIDNCKYDEKTIECPNWTYRSKEDKKYVSILYYIFPDVLCD
jgi:hypothetical protein